MMQPPMVYLEDVNPYIHRLISRHYALLGRPLPDRYAVPWWHTPTFFMDVIFSGSFCELHFFQDYGREHPCIALYATTRVDAVMLLGLYHKFELHGVPGNDPSRWYSHRYLVELGLFSMNHWAVRGDFSHRV